MGGAPEGNGAVFNCSSLDSDGSDSGSEAPATGVSSDTPHCAQKRPVELAAPQPEQKAAVSDCASSGRRCAGTTTCGFCFEATYFFAVARGAVARGFDAFAPALARFAGTFGLVVFCGAVITILQLARLAVWVEHSFGLTIRRI